MSTGVPQVSTCSPTVVRDADDTLPDFETKIVTATPSGSFMVFDINRGKMERETSGGHPRPINCISLSKVPSSASLLITGGTEGQIRVWVRFQGTSVSNIAGPS